ncbi:hypothetical protein RHMOL_Rhmol02G0268800 [Rhododendron molle]|uniref:Uncharacterized protein n=1 Tax=Rhododendron molle TaxID=49168 RepID=A0ACC0PX00_RHOML|nr:hypothetical protein RHMOL_Rhmol02G0268800 [Rhododendron molle]
MAINDVKYDETAANNTKIVEVLTSMSSRSIERDQEKALDRQKKDEAWEMQLHYLAMMSTKREQRKEDHAIPSMNISTFNPTQKAYYEGLQREIIARKDFSSCQLTCSPFSRLKVFSFCYYHHIGVIIIILSMKDAHKLLDAMSEPDVVCWSDLFSGYAQLGHENNACKFFIWVDPPTCPRGLVYGRQLQKKIKDLQEMEEDLRRLNEVAEKDKEKMMKKMDKLWKMNHELKKKNEMMWKCNVLCMVVIGLLLVLWLGSWKSTYGRMLYLP